MILTALSGILGQQGAGDGSVLLDSFGRANSTSTLGNADTGQTWSANVGTWGISSNKAYSVSGTTERKAYINHGLTDNFIVVGDITTSASTDATQAGLVVRGVDSTNLIWVELVDTASVNRVRLGRRVSNTFATAAFSTAVTIVPSTTYHVAVVVTGSLFAVYVDGAHMFSYTLSGAEATAFGSGANVGLYVNLNADPRWDNFGVYSLAEMPFVSASHDGPTVPWPLDASDTIVSGLTNVREQDSIIYDPGDPNLGTYPERLYKFYFTSDSAGKQVAFSADGVTWGTPTTLTGTAPREDFSVTTKLSATGEVYRDGDGKMWMYGENNSSSIDVSWSIDGIDWTSGATNVIPIGTGWEATLVGSPTARHDGSQFVVVYEGVDVSSFESVGVATGATPTSLTKLAANPVTQRSTFGDCIIDAWMLSDDGTEIIGLCHRGAGAASGPLSTYRVRTSETDPTAWVNGSFTKVTESLLFARNDYTRGRSDKWFVTGNDADTALVTFNLKAIP